MSTTVSVYDVRRLIGIVADLTRPSTFLLNMFFKNYLGPTGERKIAFDQDSRNRGVALFCAPLVAGRPVRERGWTTKEFTPAYMQPWMAFNALAPLSRALGEAPTGQLTVAQRQAANLVRGFADLQDISFRRLELMAAEGLMTGKQIISGEGIPEAIEVDYGREATFTKALTSTARWNESGVSPISDVEGWVQEYISENGYAPNRIVFAPDAWKSFRDDPKFEKHIDINYKRQSGGGQMDYLMLGDTQQGQLMGSLRSGNNIELWVYQQSYRDEAGTAQKVMPQWSVIVGAEHPELTQTQCFGTVIDPELGYQSEMLVDPKTGARMDFAPVHWFATRPAKGEFIQLQSAPLMALTNPNAVMGITVR